METLVIEVATDAELNARILWAAEREEPQPPGYFFETEEDLLDALPSQPTASPFSKHWRVPDLSVCASWLAASDAMCMRFTPTRNDCLESD
jgi:hypothetical protein